MAKWGEGDPRWIVEERPDSTNVNNWHWTEYNCTPWAHTLLKGMLKGLAAQSGELQVAVSDISDLAGDVTISNRKGKIKFYYELNLTLPWQGTVGALQVVGRLKLVDLTQDDQLDDYTFEIQVDDETPEKRAIRDFIRKTFLPVFRAKMAEFNNEISKEFGQKVILKTKDPKAASTSPSPDAAGAAAGSAAAAAGGATAAGSASQDAAAAKPAAAKKNVKTLNMEVEFLASGQDLFNAFVDSARVQIWTRSPATISVQPNSAFALFGGNVTGTMLETEPAKKIKMLWRLSTWPADHLSTVTLSFEQGSSSTVLKLKQEGVPVDAVESTQTNWHQYYFDRIKGIFGWGVLSSQQY